MAQGKRTCCWTKSWKLKLFKTRPTSSLPGGLSLCSGRPKDTRERGGRPVAQGERVGGGGGERVHRDAGGGGAAAAAAAGAEQAQPGQREPAARLPQDAAAAEFAGRFLWGIMFMTDLGRKSRF